MTIPYCSIALRSHACADFKMDGWLRFKKMETNTWVEMGKAERGVMARSVHSVLLLPFNNSEVERNFAKNLSSAPKKS
jgi:hypothetical protein